MTEESKLIFKDFQNSIARLKEGLRLPKSIFGRDACIKRFEMTFELSWKFLKSFMNEQGFFCNSPRKCFEQAFSLDMLEDNPLWFKMMEDRNSSVHTYSEKFADDLFSRLKDYLKLFLELEKSIKKSK